MSLEELMNLKRDETANSTHITRLLLYLKGISRISIQKKISLFAISTCVCVSNRCHGKGASILVHFDSCFLDKIHIDNIITYNNLASDWLYVVIAM